MTHYKEFLEEDEDVVLEGSDLHKHLSAMGYMDFEKIPVRKSGSQQEDECIFTDTNIVYNGILKHVVLFYSSLTRDVDFPKKQLKVILTTEALLDDHASTIYNFTQEYSCKPWKTISRKLILFGSLVTSSAYVFVYKYNILPLVFTSSAIYLLSRMVYSRSCAHRDLRHLTFLQNELYCLCKKGLKILRFGYKLKLSPEKKSEEFHAFTEDKLIHLQSILENLIKYMENITSIYYRTAEVIIALLPKNIINEDLLTKFKPNSFKVTGEVNYQSLKQLYHIYILVQSEMLHLLAIVYHSDTWNESYNKIPEEKLAYIVCKLIKWLTRYKDKLSEPIDNYHLCNMKPHRHNYKGAVTSKWQDVYMHLDITSYKIQLAYNHITAILKIIDMYANDNIIENDTIEIIVEKMNEVYKQIDTAKSFAEFSNLLVAKTKVKNSDVKNLVETDNLLDLDIRLPLIIDSDPQIEDEVFEEYIKEEYLKPLYEDDGELLQNYKLDKLLAKNFMSELKEVLVEKHKSMSERESKALRRMHKQILEDSPNDSKTDIDMEYAIPVPPPMPILNNYPRKSSKDAISTYNEDINFQNKMINLNCNIDVKNNECNRILDPTIDSKDVKENDLILHTSLSLADLKLPTKKFAINLPACTTSEETFIGSGENSDDEFLIEDSQKD